MTAIRKMPNLSRAMERKLRKWGEQTTAYDALVAYHGGDAFDGEEGEAFADLDKDDLKSNLNGLVSDILDLARRTGIRIDVFDQIHHDLLITARIDFKETDAWQRELLGLPRRRRKETAR